MSSVETLIGAAVGKAKAGAVISEINNSIGIREVTELKVWVIVLPCPPLISFTQLFFE